MRNTKFNTKDEYLAYRKQWKADYEVLSQIIRDLRYLITTSCSTWNKYYQLYNGKNGKLNWFFVHDTTQKELKENEKYNTLHVKYKNCSINYYKQLATNMLEELKQAKIDAQNQYVLKKIEIVY